MQLRTPPIKKLPMITHQYHLNPLLNSPVAVRLAPRPTAPGRNTLSVLAHSLHLGPAGPRITHLVHMGLSHLPQRNSVSSFGWFVQGTPSSTSVTWRLAYSTKSSPHLPQKRTSADSFMRPHRGQDSPGIGAYFAPFGWEHVQCHELTGPPCPRPRPPRAEGPRLPTPGRTQARSRVVNRSIRFSYRSPTMIRST